MGHKTLHPAHSRLFKRPKHKIYNNFVKRCVDKMSKIGFKRVLILSFGFSQSITELLQQTELSHPMAERHVASVFHGSIHFS